MILLAGQAIIIPLSKVQKFGMKIEMTFFQVTCRFILEPFPHLAVDENLGLSLDILSGCLAKVVCIPVELRNFGLGL